MCLVLSEQELTELTGRIRPSAQARQLRALGIDFRQRTDGSIVVLRFDLEQRSESEQSGVTLNFEAV